MIESAIVMAGVQVHCKTRWQIQTFSAATRRFTSARGALLLATEFRPPLRRFIARSCDHSLSVAYDRARSATGIQFDPPVLNFDYFGSGTALLIGVGACPTDASGALPVHACYFEQANIQYQPACLTRRACHCRMPSVRGRWHHVSIMAACAATWWSS